MRKCGNVNDCIRYCFHVCMYVAIDVKTILSPRDRLA